MTRIRRAAAGLIALAAIILSGGAVASTARADTTLPVGAFRLVNYGSGKCVEVVPDQFTFSLFENGDRIWQRTCDGAPQQSWLLVRATNGTIAGMGNVVRYHLINQYTGLCLDLKDGKTNDGAIIQQWTCNGTSTTMMWSLYDDFYSSRQVVNDRSGYCLDVAGGSWADHALLQNYHCTNGNTAQHFYLSQ